MWGPRPLEDRPARKASWCPQGGRCARIGWLGRLKQGAWRRDKSALSWFCPAGRFLFVPLQPQVVIHDALGPTVGVREELPGVSAARENRGIEAQVLLHPVSANAISLHRAGRRQGAGVADGFAVDEGFDLATTVGAAKRQAQGRLAMGRFGQSEGDGPFGAADVFWAGAGLWRR